MGEKLGGMSKRAAGGRKSKPNVAHLLFEKHAAELGLLLIKEWRFDPERRWRFDYVDYVLNADNQKCLMYRAFEIEGAIYTRGRHTRGVGYQADLDKYNQATAMGFRVFRFSTTDVLRGRAKSFIAEHLLGQKGREG